MRRLALVVMVVAGCADADNDGASFTDCDDADPRANPDATEVCNGIDDDCDGQIDEEVAIVAWQDRDGDGFGDPDRQRRVCAMPEDGVPNGDDCDDAHADAFPGGTETCDGLDDDCDGQVDEDVQEPFYVDADGDGHGVAGSPISGCFVGAGYAREPDDCDDAEPLAWTGAPEVCDGVDNDCDDAVDEELPLRALRPDADGDSFGDPTAFVGACGPQPGAVVDDHDCDDAVSATNPGAPEIAGNHVDDDCDGTIDETGDLEVPAAYATLDDALGAAHPGDVIRLAPGLYTGPFDLTGHDVVIAGAGCGRTILYGGDVAAVLTLDGGGVEDLSIRGGLAGGLSTHGDVTARRLCVEDNEAVGDGGGVRVVSGTLVLQDSLIVGNATRQMGGGIAVEAEGTLQAARLDVRDNEARFDGGGLAVLSGDADVVASVFAGNVAQSDGGAIAVREDPLTPEAIAYATFEHVTLVGNVIPHDADHPDAPGAYGSAIYVAEGFHPDEGDPPSSHEVTVRHAILAYNRPSFESPFWAGILTITAAEGSAFHGNGGTDLRGGWRLDAAREAPAFVAFDAETDPRSWDLRLRPDSAYVDFVADEQDPDASVADLGAYGGPDAAVGWNAGDPDATGADVDDDGLPDAWEVATGLHPWEDDAADDVDGDGLDATNEWVLATDPLLADTDGDLVLDGAEGRDDPRRADQAPIAVITPLREVLPGGTLELDGSWSFDPQGDDAGYAWSIVGLPPGSAATLSGATSAVGALTVDVAGVYEIALDVDDGVRTSRATVQLVVADAIVVPDDAATLEDALALAAAGDTIALRSGTHAGRITGGPLDLTVVGLDDDVVIEGPGIGSVVSWIGSGALTLRHLTLTNGFAGSGGGLYCEGCTGDGCHSPRPVVHAVDLVVRDNEATTEGGGLYLEGCDLDAERLVVAGNTADDGAGMSTFEAAVSIGDGRFLDNVATGQGGGARFDENQFTVVVHHTVFQGNSADDGASFLFRASASETYTGHFEQCVFADEVGGSSIVRVGNGRVELVSPIFVRDVAPALVEVVGDNKAWILDADVFASSGELIAEVGTADISLLVPSSILELDPDVTRGEGDGGTDVWTLRPSSPLLDAGFAERRDVDGSPDDFGIAGGPRAPGTSLLDSLDLDGDGMGDGWEQRFGLDRHADDADDDLDGDDVTNLAEYEAGTRPDVP